jgi:ABC-type multidrug transport system fused ATPase/permease subunit
MQRGKVVVFFELTRIIVMKQGFAVDYDTPTNLLTSQDSHLREYFSNKS